MKRAKKITAEVAIDLAKHDKQSTWGQLLRKLAGHVTSYNQARSRN